MTQFTRHLIIILGDQLHTTHPALEDFDTAQDKILMAEVAEEATHVWSHQARIAVFLSAMRHFAESLVQRKMPLVYLKLGEHKFENLTAVWQHYLTQLKPVKVIICEPGEYRLEQAIVALCEQLDIALAVRDDAHFMCSRAEFKHWAGPASKNQNKQLRMEFFYRMMRQKYDVLMDNGKPVGGAWNFDAANRKAFPRSGPQVVPKPPAHIDAITKQAIADVKQHFSAHPGSLDYFIWPVTRAAALEFLTHFIKEKLADFGVHQDAMWQLSQPALDPQQAVNEQQTSAYLWHSLLSSSLNLKLLDPREVIAAAVKAYRQRGLPLASVEGFIRQILGWREFIRGMYWLDMPKMAEANHFRHRRDLPGWYWTGKTQMNCMHQVIDQTMQYGYAHHIQRLMVTGMFGLLAEVEPKQLADWYLAVYVDAIEWVELPNVIGMALYADGGRFTSKPYAASGAYIKRMSNYCDHCQYRPEIKTGKNACPVTTLYWYFLLKHEAAFANNPRTSLMVSHLKRMAPAEKQAITDQARQMLKNLQAL